MSSGQEGVRSDDPAPLHRGPRPLLRECVRQSTVTRELSD